jgi:retron-type reverse transcriptase
MGPKGKLGKNDKLQFINRIGIYENHNLKQHWPVIREQLLNGTYEPRPVRRVEIPKPDGGVRKLGMPKHTPG